jgi:hypothetical protein
MPAIGYQYNFLRGLSDFWQRFFADANQLEAFYEGSAVLIGQAYLDLMSAALGVSLKDAVALDREYYRLVAIREDQTRFVKGLTSSDDRWAFTLEDPLVKFASLDNRVYEPTASLEELRDYEIVDRVTYFKADPTDPTGNGLPLDGFARRALDVSVGGRFTNSAVSSWLVIDVKKGDTLRILDVATTGEQRKRSDHVLALVRSNVLYVDVATPFATTAVGSGLNYVVLRIPPEPDALEQITFSSNIALLAHTRVDQGSVRLYAKNNTGADVVENVDYIVNYETGKITRIGGTPWPGGDGPYGVTYTWRVAVATGTTGVIAGAGGTARVIQIAMWAPDARIDRRTLANNFGVFINREADSSEAYRAFLQGVFQLYMHGPVLERVESALNVVLNFPVARDDGETVLSVDTTDPLVDRVSTRRPVTNTLATYEFPKGTPLRSDLVEGLSMLSFEPFTEAVTVTDYVLTPNWWHGAVIPLELFEAVDGNDKPDIARRTASPAYVEHVVGAVDAPEVGDPGLFVGGDDDGFIPQEHGASSNHSVFRRRMAFVLMDRYLKHHTFTVTFDAGALSAGAGADFAQSLTDLNELVLSAKPSHTFAFTRPDTFFRDEIETTESALDLSSVVGSGGYGPDQFIFADGPPVVGSFPLFMGDYFKYETFTSSVTYTTVGVGVALLNAPSSPRRRYVVRVYVAGAISGKRLVENVDYTVNYTTATVTRLTVWDATTVNVTYTQLNIGSVLDAPISADEMPVLVGGTDPSIITATFDPTAAGWDGVPTPTTAPRDLGVVERALIVYAHAP